MGVFPFPPTLVRSCTRSTNTATRLVLAVSTADHHNVTLQLITKWQNWNRAVEVDIHVGAVLDPGPDVSYCRSRSLHGKCSSFRGRFAYLDQVILFSVCACVCACVRACVRASVRAYGWMPLWLMSHKTS